MKKKILLFTVVAGMGYVTLSSNGGGPATGSAGNRTGAKGSTGNCASGCHGSGAGTTVSIEVDSGSSMTPTTHYVPGMTYTVKIHGTSTTGFTKYGFQFASVSGTGASQVQAGTASGFPSGVAAHTASSLSLVEQTATRTSSTAGVYDVQFSWTAPSAVGTITMYCTLNSVNGNTSDDNADLSGNISKTLTPIAPAGIAEVANSTTVSAFPNPVVNILHLQTEHAGSYSVKAYDLNGRMVTAELLTINGTASLNTSNWPAGLYQVSVEKDGNMQVIPVVKQ